MEDKPYDIIKDDMNALDKIANDSVNCDIAKELASSTAKLVCQTSDRLTPCKRSRNIRQPGYWWTEEIVTLLFICYLYFSVYML